MTEDNENAIDNGYSVQSLIAWITYAGEQGLMNLSTAATKRASVTEILVRGDILQEFEKDDVRVLDLDSIFNRYIGRYSHKYPLNTLNAYRSRTASSIKLFLKYKEDPLGFTADAQAKMKTKKETSPKISGQSKASQTAPTAPPKNRSTNSAEETFDIRVPIDNGKSVITISNIPFDIKKEDAQKISAVVLAYSNK